MRPYVLHNGFISILVTGEILLFYLQHICSTKPHQQYWMQLGVHIITDK